VKSKNDLKLPINATDVQKIEYLITCIEQTNKDNEIYGANSINPHPNMQKTLVNLFWANSIALNALKNNLSKMGS
jgi:hypothetical protein